MATTSKIVEKLNLKSHPEGGFYSETMRDTSIILSKSQLPSHYKVDRPVSTCIYFLLAAGNVSLLHKIPCAETWHFYCGEPIYILELDDQGSTGKLTCLGPDVLDDFQKVQFTVPPNVWFGAFPAKDVQVSDNMEVIKLPARDSEQHFSLVGCTCAPAFQFEDFELAKRSELIQRFPGFNSLITHLTVPE